MLRLACTRSRIVFDRLPSVPVSILRRFSSDSDAAAPTSESAPVIAEEVDKPASAGGEEEESFEGFRNRGAFFALLKAHGVAVEEGDDGEEPAPRYARPKQIREKMAKWNKRKILFTLSEVPKREDLRTLISAAGSADVVDRAMEIATGGPMDTDELEVLLHRMHRFNPVKWIDETIEVDGLRLGSPDSLDEDGHDDPMHSSEVHPYKPLERGIGEPTVEDLDKNIRAYPEEREAKDIDYRDDVTLHEYTHIMDVGRHTKVTTGGRIFSYSVLLVTGNGHGTGGMAYARGTSADAAVKAATKQAKKNAVTIHRWRDCTLGESVMGEFKKAGVRIRALPPDSGYGGGPLIQQVFRTFGLTDVTGEFYGPSRLRRKRYTAVFRALQSAERPDNIARKLGHKYMNPDRIWRRGNRVWSLD